MRVLRFAVSENAGRTYDKEFHFRSERILAQADFKTGDERGHTSKIQERSSACRVALIGFGTVGRAVAKILCENGDGSLRLTHICNRNVERKKQPGFQPMSSGPTTCSRC